MGTPPIPVKNRSHSRSARPQHYNVDLPKVTSRAWGCQFFPGCSRWVLAVRKRNPIWSSCRAEDRFLCFFALRMTTGPKIPGTVIPRRVFTQPGSFASCSVEAGHTSNSAVPRNQTSSARLKKARRGLRLAAWPLSLGKARGAFGRRPRPLIATADGQIPEFKFTAD